MAFTAEVVHEVPTAEGVPIFLTTLSEVALRKPDRLLVRTVGDGPGSMFLADGVEMLRFDGRERTVARKPAPSGMAKILEEAHGYGIDLPFADVLVEQPFGGIEKDLTAAFVVGRSRLVGGTLTDIVAFSDRTMHAQIWIGAADKLPRQLFVTGRADGRTERNTVAFGNWRLDGRLPDRLFDARRFATAKAVPFETAEDPL